MSKRRRERDRPKAAHDAPYNPNKRILLSYESDEDVADVANELPAVGTGKPLPVVDAASEDQNEDYFEDDALLGVRDPDEDVEQEGEADADEEEAVEQHNSLWSRGSSKNATTGQWAALGSLSYQWDDAEEGDEEYDSTEEEAMAYLRSVRSERQGMPMVFKAPKTYTHEEIYETGIGDSRGYFEDGAYVASATQGPQIPDSAKAIAEPREAFTAALKLRFLKQREEVHKPPDAEHLATLDDKHPISFPADSNKAHAEWHRLVRYTQPHMAQIQSMNQDDAFRLLELIQKHYLHRENEISTMVSTWIWALLARLGDVGAMDNDQVWTVREFGKKAILVQISLSDPATAEQLERAATEDNEGAVEAPNGSSDSLRESNGEDIAKVIPPSSATATSAANNVQDEACSTARQNTLATLDSVLVVVGEIFGQRDLLEFRQPWMAQTQ